MRAGAPTGALVAVAIGVLVGTLGAAGVLVAIGVLVGTLGAAGVLVADGVAAGVLVGCEPVVAVGVGHAVACKWASNGVTVPGVAVAQNAATDAFAE